MGADSTRSLPYAKVPAVLECVVNVSEGRRPELLEGLAQAATAATTRRAVTTASGTPMAAVIDVHSDPDHNRSVLTLAGRTRAVREAVRALVRRAVQTLDLSAHRGAHPRFGVVDVVPFVPLFSEPMATAMAERDAFANWAGRELGLACFLYGPERGGAGRTLPEVRRGAFTALAPDCGPTAADPRVGACAVGARPVMLAWNLWLGDWDVSAARRLAGELRGPDVRALAFELPAGLQLSFNLLAPLVTGPAAVYDRVVRSGAPVVRAELVGLAPAALLEATDRRLWTDLDLDPARTIEARLEGAGIGFRAPGSGRAGEGAPI